ncbi:helix-turn-helix domain-containing protein [Henriciella pelagia]|uniref:helix-turn-helix domain-containing protein n=1 Tax=Henriciella pelagia TaxID=1977912 RepID=UPI003511558C
MSQARYSIIPSAAIEDDRLTPLDLRVLAVIGTFLGKDLVCWPSQSTIAEKAKCTRQSVNLSVKKLSELGYLEVIQTASKGMKKALKYRVILDVRISDNDVGKADNDVGSGDDNDVGSGPDNIEDTQRKIPTYFEEVWAKWSSQGRKRSKGKANCLQAFKKIAENVGANELRRACLDFAKATEDKFHPGFDRWLDGRKFEAWLPEQQKDPELDLSVDETDWAQPFRDYCDLGLWDRDELGPAPHEPGCRAPAKFLKGAATLLTPKHRHHEGIVINFNEAKSRQGDAA